MIALTVTLNKISKASLLPVSIHFIFKFPQLFQRRLLVLAVTMLESPPRPVLCCYGCGSNPATSSSPSPLTFFHPSGKARGQRGIQCLLYNIMGSSPFPVFKVELNASALMTFGKITTIWMIAPFSPLLSPALLCPSSHSAHLIVLPNFPPLLSGALEVVFYSLPFCNLCPPHFSDFRHQPPKD